MNENSKKSFESAITSLKNASNHCPDKENGKLWFYKGVAEYEVNKDDSSNLSECIKNLKEAVTYDYYDIEILKKLLRENPRPVDNPQENSNNILLLYYLKRYSEIINNYSNDSSHINCLPNLIKDYKNEGAYYCALSHYEFKDFKRSFEIFNKLICLNEIVKNYESFKNQIEDSSIINELNQIETDISNFEKTIKRIDINSLININSFNVIDDCCNKLINDFAKLKAKENAVLDTKKEYFSHELSELIDDIKVFRKEIEEITKDVEPYANFLKKIIPNSWYYKGLILYELRNNFKDQKLLKAVFDGFEIVTVEDNDKKEFKEQYKKFVNNKDGKNLKEYMLWDVGKKTKFVKYLNDPSNNGPKAGEILQKIFDIESQTAFEKALEEYNKIIESSQTFGLYYDKALVLDELKRYKEAIESLDEFLKNKPRDAKVWLKKGTILFKIAKDEAIETTSEESKKENKKEKSSCEEEITGIEAAKNALEKSIQYFKILIDENPGNPDHWYNKGTAHSSLAEVLIKTRDYKGSLNEYEETIKAFDNATDLNPIFALAWNNKGNAYLKLKKYNKAIEAFEKAFEINPNYYLALHNKGDALYSLGKYEEAIEIYNQVIKKDKDTNEEKQSDPNVYKSWNDKGLAYYKLERYDEAVKAFNEAIEINPTFADGRTNKGVVFYKLEMFSEAKKAFEEALKIDPGNVRASNNLGFVLAIDGELDQAKKLFENTLQENPDFIYGHINLAELFLNNGGIKRASEEIERTLNIVKGSEDTDIDLDYIYYLDGRIKIEAQSKDKQAQTEDKQIQSKDISGKYSEAVKSFEKALSFNVENPGLILWSVYVKYLCQKFETYGKTNSSEEPKPGKENVSPKVEDIRSNEFSNSIVSDLEKVLNFCSLSKMKKHTSYQQITQSWWFKKLSLIPVLIVIVIVIVAISILVFFGLVEFSILLKTTLLILLFYFLFLISFSLLLYLLGVPEKRFVFKKCIFEQALWVDRFLVFRVFKFEWIFKRIISYIKFIFNDKYLEQKIEGQKGSDRHNDSELTSLIKIKSQLIKFNKHKEIKAYTLYLLGYFYFKLQDYTTAKEKLQECINLRPEARTDKAARELLENIWKHKIKPPFWTYWFNSPVKTWRRRASGTFIILGILLILFVHAEDPQPVAWNNSTSNDSKIFIPDQINVYPYIISYYPSNNISSDSTNISSDSTNISSDSTDNISLGFTGNISPDSTGNISLGFTGNISLGSTGFLSNSNNIGNDNINDGNNNTTWNILTPARVNIYPDLPMDNFFDALLMLILILILISPSIRITETIKIALKKGVGDVSLDLGPIEAPPEFNFELSPSLMQDVIRRLDENL